MGRKTSTGDAGGAFLQGGAQSEREEPIFVIPPKDPVVPQERGTLARGHR